MFSEVKLGEN